MRIFFFVIILLASNALRAQEEETQYFDKDQLGLEIFSNQWLNAPDGVTISPYSLAFNVQMMYTLIGKNSHIALAGGFGFMAENYQIDALPEKSDGILTFNPINSDLNYKSNKIRFNTFEVPLEIRIRTNKNSRNKTWKLYLGAKGGYLFQSMHKYNGANPENQKEHLKQKTFNIPYTEAWSYGVTARIGYGQFLISGYYALSNRFQTDRAPELFPLHIGVTFFIY
ncbi:MAG: outer membrane beta-barrel protein [Salinivirgaceae bacterium]|jgi:hypothetical protein|nr:outer membrane beta-barrel protein [Salinivirgaceae bacterium]